MDVNLWEKKKNQLMAEDLKPNLFIFNNKTLFTGKTIVPDELLTLYDLLSLLHVKLFLLLASRFRYQMLMLKMHPRVQS